MPGKILVLNGPNLNMLGIREPGVYGTATYGDVVDLCEKTIKASGYKPDIRQSNYEGELVTWIQEAAGQMGGVGKLFRPNNTGVAGVIINAGAYTHTSIAIHDALRIVSCPVIEVHLTNPQTREAFRHISYIQSIALKSVVGQGLEGYRIAIEALVEKLAH